jgi:hypothetical protein
VSDLHERLNSALAAAEPSPAPVEAAMHAGRKIRNRRRAGLLAGTVAVTVAAAAVAGVPAFGHHAALPPAPVTGHTRVTVNPPGPHAPAGLIASGVIGSTPWTLSVVAPDSNNCVFEGTGTSYEACNEALMRPSAADPIEFEGMNLGDANQSFVSFGQVWKGVVSTRVELSDGTMLTLHPAKVDGLSFMAFAVPAHLPIDSVTTYSRTGEIATAIPFTAADGFPIFGMWLRPGQAPPPRVTGTFGSGTVVTAYLGPWGTCVDLGSGGSDLIPLVTEPGTTVLGASDSVVFGAAAESVSYVTITRKHGRALRAEPAAVGPQRFWAVPLSQPDQAGAHWAAYDRAGKKVASGSVA